MRTLKIGHIELIPIAPNKRHFRFYSELKDYLNELGPGYKFTTEIINPYLRNEFHKLGIYQNFSKLYKVSVVSQIDVVTDNEDFVIIEDEDEIENFYKGEESFGFGEDGEEFEVHIDSCLSIEESRTDTCYIYKEI
jgi:hypothetical protein